jgi:hypothetical protein
MEWTSAGAGARDTRDVSGSMAIRYAAASRPVISEQLESEQLEIATHVQVLIRRSMRPGCHPMSRAICCAGITGPLADVSIAIVFVSPARRADRTVDVGLRHRIRSADVSLLVIGRIAYTTRRMMHNFEQFLLNRWSCYLHAHR